MISGINFSLSSSHSDDWSGSSLIVQMTEELQREIPGIYVASIKIGTNESEVTSSVCMQRR